MRLMGGLLTLEDLAGYRAKIREPLRAKYKIGDAEWEILSAPPPSSGGTAIIEALNVLQPVSLRSWNDAQSVHWVAETMRRVFADRAAHLADADFNHIPVRGLTDPRYAAQIRGTIDPERASSSSTVRAGDPTPFEPAGNTTHFSVVDAAGNAVANTYTINESYGSGATTTTGFLLNDTMDDFTTQPGVPNKLFGLVQSDANAIAPGKRALSSMSPTILLRDGKLSFVTGSPGGPRIISATLLSVLNWIGASSHDAAAAQGAINAPRFHHQWMPDELRIEETFPAGARAELERRGHKIVVRSWIGQVEAIAIDPKTGERLGAPDPRRLGSAIGY
jgi:gamma-glutamyltranspeptidase/glutathione hydrolase